MENLEFATVGSILVMLGIVFGEDRLIGYSFIGVGIVLSVISVLKSRRKEERSLVEMKWMLKKNAEASKWQYVIFVLGVSVCLIGALVMVAGEPLLGENNAGIATIVGIVGIGMIATSSKKNSKETKSLTGGA